MPARVMTGMFGTSPFRLWYWPPGGKQRRFKGVEGVKSVSHLSRSLHVYKKQRGCVKLNQNKQHLGCSAKIEKAKTCQDVPSLNPMSTYSRCQRPTLILTVHGGSFVCKVAVRRRLRGPRAQCLANRKSHNTVWLKFAFCSKPFVTSLVDDHLTSNLT